MTSGERLVTIHYLVGPERVEARQVQLAPPGPGEILLQVEVALTCGTDLKVFRAGGHARMLRPPCPFGHEMAGRVAAVGTGVTAWREGDAVVVANSSPCGECAPCRSRRENLCEHLEYLNGAFGEALIVPERFVRTSVVARPAGLAPEIAAAAEPLACVLHGRTRLVGALGLDVPPSVLVVGAGSIGLLFVAALRQIGSRVAIVDPHPERLAIARVLGAQQAVQVRHDPDAASELELIDGEFDAIVDAAGLRFSSSAAAWTTRLRPGAAVLHFAGLPAGSSESIDLHALHYRELALLGAYHYAPRHYRQALDLLRDGAIDIAPLLTAERPLGELTGALQAMARREAIKVILRP